MKYKLFRKTIKEGDKINRISAYAQIIAAVTTIIVVVLSYCSLLEVKEANRLEFRPYVNHRISISKPLKINAVIDTIIIVFDNNGLSNALRFENYRSLETDTIPLEKKKYYDSLKEFVNSNKQNRVAVIPRQSSNHIADLIDIENPLLKSIIIGEQKYYLKLIYFYYDKYNSKYEKSCCYRIYPKKIDSINYYFEYQTIYENEY